MVDATHYLVKMAGRNDERLLVDPGSPDNLVGENWSWRMEQLSKQAGHGPAVRSAIPAVTVGGVGKKAQSVTNKVVHRIALDSGEHGTYEAPEIKDSDVPALLGMRALTKHKALIDVGTRRLYFVGQGGYKLQLSPGSQVHDLVLSTNGHLMLPCSAFEKARQGKQLAFEVSTSQE